MRKYRKKPVVIDAIQFKGEENKFNVVEFLKGQEFDAEFIRNDDGDLYRIDVHTLEGTMSARIGDWIIKGIKGEVYPCKPDIFEATYEEVK